MRLPVKVLQVTIGDGSFGGVASFLLSYYSHMDHSRVHFDFLYCGENSLQSKAGDPVLADSTITTLHILKRNNNGISEYMKLLKALDGFFDQYHYDVVHVNSGNLFLNVLVAFTLKSRAKLICHSHGTQANSENAVKWKRYLKRYLRTPGMSYIIRKADALFACSTVAGLSLFGERGIQSDKFRLIKNAIDLSKYYFDPAQRKSVRGAEKRMIIGHVGRLTPVKNHSFLLDLFSELHKQDPNTVLWLIGDGELREAIEKKISELEMTDSVLLLGQRNDVADLLQAMDLFVFPSFREGLSIVMIEAQASGLTILASDSISAEHNITDRVFFMPLQESPSAWAAAIMDLRKRNEDRNIVREALKEAGYEIHCAARNLEETYLSMCDRGA